MGERSVGDGGAPLQIVGDAGGRLTALIRRRHAVREGFTGGPVDEAALREVISCGLAAPSSKRAQPWRLHVVTDRRLLSRFAEAVASAEGASTYVPSNPSTGHPWERWSSTVAESAEVLAQVSVGIFVENRGVFSDGGMRALLAADPRRLEAALLGYTLEVLGIGTAVENMWLAAHAIGLRGTFMGDVVIAEPVIARQLGIEGDLLGVLALGPVDEAAAEPGGASQDLTDTEQTVWHGRLDEASRLEPDR